MYLRSVLVLVWVLVYLLDLNRSQLKVLIQPVLLHVPQLVHQNLIRTRGGNLWDGLLGVQLAAAHSSPGGPWGDGLVRRQNLV